MKKIIGFSCVFLFMGFIAFGQNAVQTTALTTNQTKTCKPIPPEECAAKMGISLEEYLKLPKKCNAATASSTQDSPFWIVKVSDAKTAQRTSCSSVKECARKLGISVEECKALCKSSTACKTASTKATSTVASSDL